MVKRLGAVAWWIGALVAVLFTGLQVSSHITRLDCPQFLQLEKDIEAVNDAAMARYLKDHSTGYDLADKWDALGNTAKDGRDTEDFRKKADQCKRSLPGIYTYIFVAVITSFLWTIAFVLTGSFWHPPKRDT